MSFKIIVQERGSDRRVVLCRVETNPYDILDAALEKTLLVQHEDGHMINVRKYDRVWVVTDEA